MIDIFASIRKTAVTELIGSTQGIPIEKHKEGVPRVEDAIDSHRHSQMDENLVENKRWAKSGDLMKYLNETINIDGLYPCFITTDPLSLYLFGSRDPS